MYMGAPIGPMRGVIYKMDRTRDAKHIAAELRSEAYLPSKGAITILDTVIPNSVAFCESASFKVPVHTLDARGAGPAPREILSALVLELCPHLENVLAALAEPTESRRAEL